MIAQLETGLVLEAQAQLIMIRLIFEFLEYGNFGLGRWLCTNDQDPLLLSQQSMLELRKVPSQNYWKILLV